MSHDRLHNRIDLVNIPFTERGSRLLLLRQGNRLFIRLVERWAKWEKEVGHYRQRPPLITDFTFRTAEDTPLDFEVDSYPHCVHLHTPAGTFDWVYFDTETLMVRLPAGHYGMEFMVYAENGQADSRGGTLHGKRNTAYTTNAQIISNSVEKSDGDRFKVRLTVKAETGDALLLNITPRLGYNRSVPKPDVVLAAAEANWDAWFSATPPVLDEYRAQYDYAWWIMRSGLINTRYYFTREALLPSKVHYVGVWHWDQVFHALAYRHVDTNLAENQLRIVLDHQREDGMLPDAIHDEGLVTHLTLPVDADVTKPPIMTWIIMKLYEKSQHFDFLEEVYEPLSRWNQWWVHNNMTSSGLCAYQHPFSSGLDDSPLWDGGMPVVAPDLNTYLVLQNESLAKIARLIDQPDAANTFDQMAAELQARMIEQLWDDEAGLFRAKHGDQPISTVTPFSLLPLLSGELPPRIKEKVIANLFDPKLFWSPYPLSTVSVSDPAFDPMMMWRGPVWINVNYFFVEALKRAGEFEKAAELRRKTLELVMKYPDIYEYYNPLTSEKPPKSAPMFGWSASLFIEMVLDETEWQQTRPPAST